MKLDAPAKVNLALHILGRREDGYHNLSSIVGFTNFGDTICIKPSTAPNIEFNGPFSAGLDPTTNSITKALDWFNISTGRATNFNISVTKNIPVEAGLGGGTADAAAVLRFLYRFYDLEMPNPQRLAPLGADVPVSFFGQPAIMRGTGEDITPTDFDKAWGVVLCNPGIPIPTAKVFARLQSFDDDIADRQSWSIEALQETTNTMTPAAETLAPQISERINALVDLGADFVRMSGSGATVFALTPQPKALAAAYQDRFQNDWTQPSYFKRSTT